jgi:hypothetical protein
MDAILFDLGGVLSDSRPAACGYVRHRTHTALIPKGNASKSLFANVLEADKAKALSSAVQKVRSISLPVSYAHPHYWAPFMLIGD